MSPTAMLTLIFAAFAMFAWSASRRWHLLLVGRPAADVVDHVGVRLRGTWRFAFRQEKMDYYNPAGIAHKLIFAGFVVLLLRTLLLWGRGFYAPFNMWVLGPAQPLGQYYELLKDVSASLVIAGTLVFFYYRIFVKPRRMALSFEGLLILAIIFTMMIADMTYDGASLVLASHKGTLCNVPLQLGAAGPCAAIETIIAPLGGVQWEGEWSPWPGPAGSLFALFFHTLSPGALVVLARAGFWTHATLVLLFLNLLPHSKHFHVITAIPNIFLRSLRPAGQLAPVAENAEKLMEAVGIAAEAADPLAQPIGIARIEQFTWKGLLDFYTCTECGRCSDNCPAHQTGKILSPKHLTLALRDHLYEREEELVALATTDTHRGPDPVNLVPEVIHPDVLWACTSCRACEEQCPVLISYVDKIIDMRRSLVMVRGEFPHELAKPFQGMESNGNPWNLSRMDRALWSDGLGLVTMKDRPGAAVLFWVGCAASYDDRAKKIARATATLLKVAGVDFAILGQEENCTGDPARRAGNEFLFATLAEGNAATINAYKEGGGVRTVVTTCPHCFNTLKNEYPDFGLKVEVIHHADFLLGLLAEGKLVARSPVAGRVVYHDSCYLGRYNGIYDSPREILKRIPGVELVEAEYWTKQRGLCCGAGGAQMWMEEQNQDRVNVKRTLQLVDALGSPAKAPSEKTHGPKTPDEKFNGEKTIASACPFCMTMLTDGIKSKNLEDKIKQLDVAELLERACRPAPASAETGAGAVATMVSASLVALSSLFFPVTARAQSLEPPPPLAPSTVAPSPAASGPTYATSPASMPNTPVMPQTPRDDTDDSGLGLEWVWLNAEVGASYVNMQSFSASNLALVKTESSGPAFGVGAGVRLVFLTLGVRVRDLLLSSIGSLWELNAEAALHTRIWRIDPYLGVRGGYNFVGSLSSDSVQVAGGGTPSDVSVHGFNVGPMVGIDFYLAKVISLGADLDAQFLFLQRPKPPLPPALQGQPVPAQYQALYNDSGSSVGFGVTGAAHIGIHF